MLKKNVGSLDRIIRIALGIALIAGFFLNSGASFGWLYLVAGSIALATGVMSSCALYSIIGISTRKLEK
ncbi:YgaP family membrane protein [Roseovarius rhodophyticola]|uniref:DUF2892 domain-containing protein n=1 Tax=Roseovarius rhodophyticola TaxID=3080827 RepID=A0ABZ2TH45_9RHOB|nr:DUF2892 domain-containing protein [Roseovarius sp. W115]MDV2927980.1 DUF2892 domain-containing protein [Roseovarius sp. W115]